MSEYNSKAPYFVAAVVGVLHAICLGAIWAVLAVEQPIVRSILDNYAGVWNESLLRIVIYLHDLIANILIAIPFAVLLALFKPTRSWRYLWVAAFVSILFVNAGLLIDPEWLTSVLRLPSFYIGTLVTAISLPIAFLTVSAAFRRASAA